MIKNIKKTDFFIVGAPKCGTTALHSHLSKHPNIFMLPKELHFFGSDIGFNRSKQKQLQNIFNVPKLNKEVNQIDQSCYLNLLQPATPQQVCGEASVWYLYSKKAAGEIHQFNPYSKIIIILRDPKAMIPSLHSQFIFDGDELITKINKALLKDINRINKNKNLKSCNFKNNRPEYINSVLYYEQVKRYISIFGKNQVLVLFHDEMKTNFTGFYHSVLNFLNIPTDFLPSNEQINKNRHIKSPLLNKICRKPPKWLIKSGKLIFPCKSLRRKLHKSIKSVNVSEQPRSEISEELKDLIIKNIKDDVFMLSELLHKDLSKWLK